jgi:hypothetical protein
MAFCSRIFLLHCGPLPVDWEISAHLNEGGKKLGCVLFFGDAATWLQGY